MPSVNPSGGGVGANPPISGDLPSEDCLALGLSLLNLLSDSRNKVPCSVREKVMEIYFKLQRLIMSLTAGKSCAAGQVLELRRELEGLRDCPPQPADGGAVAAPTLYADILAHRAVAPGAPPASSPPSRVSSAARDGQQEQSPASPNGPFVVTSKGHRHATKFYIHPR